MFLHVLMLVYMRVCVLCVRWLRMRVVFTRVCIYVHTNMSTMRNKLENAQAMIYIVPLDAFWAQVR